MTNPYRDLADHQFWRRSISGVERHLVDPVIDPRFRIAPTDRVVTAGSCFAQHISRRLQEAGFNYFVPEDGADLPPDERKHHQYGVFSARYGNIYTTAQLLQLFLECTGGKAPRETAWQRPDGRYIDPYRQQVEPDGFASPEEVAAARQAHLAAARRAFLECDIFIFTLGLTEAWRGKDGRVFPLAPGVAGGAFDPQAYDFVNFKPGQALTDLDRFLCLLKEANPGVKVLLTVSPVPLIATYEPRSVLVSTCYSKSVLRVVAEMARANHDWVDYFPSYEIVTGNHAGNAYFDPDLREVSPRGVAHVMRCFMRHMVQQDGKAPAAAGLGFDAGMAASADIICDEEMIAAARDAG